MRVAKGRKVALISILGRISGNVNADGVIGQRITIKKMYSSTGETIPFVSSRAIKRAIRDVLADRGYSIDPFIAGRKGALDLSDSGKPDIYIDNDLFGYMYTEGKKAYRRQGPVAMSYFKAVRDTPIKAEFGARFPRSSNPNQNPVPFEVEVADFIGRLCTIIYDYIGDFNEEVSIQGNNNIKVPELPLDEKRKRLKDFLEILLEPAYVLPRRTNSLSIPDYIVALIGLSSMGPKPICNYLDIDSDGKPDGSLLNKLVERYKGKEYLQLYLIDYKDSLKDFDTIKKVDIGEAVDLIVDFLFPKG